MPASSRGVLVYEKLRPGEALMSRLIAHGLDPFLPFGPASCLLREAPLSERTFIELASDYPAVLGVSGAKITRAVLQALPKLRFISKIGIGHDVIDLRAATDYGVQVTNTPSLVEIDGVAEHTVALLLAAAKRFDFYTPARMRHGLWLDPAVRPQLLSGRTLGLVGFGRIGRAVASRLAGWGMHIVATDLPDRTPAPHPGIRFVGLTELLTSADFVSVHAATTAGAAPLLDGARLTLLKPGAVLINTARGGAIDQEALRRELETGRLRVAGLDVFDPEPPGINDPILGLPNVIVSPHSAAASVEAEEDMEAIAATNLSQLFDGLQPEFLLNPGARTIIRELGSSTEADGLLP